MHSYPWDLEDKLENRGFSSSILTQKKNVNSVISTLCFCSCIKQRLSHSACFSEIVIQPPELPAVYVPEELGLSFHKIKTREIAAKCWMPQKFLSFLLLMRLKNNSKEYKCKRSFEASAMQIYKTAVSLLRNSSGFPQFFLFKKNWGKPEVWISP